MRSSYRNHGRGRGGFNRARGFQRQARSAYLPDPLSTQRKLDDILQDDLEKSPIASGGLKITGLRYIASYNWVEETAPTIVVPGKPPRWQPPTQAQQLKEDSGSYFRDPNGARFPSFPIEPAVRAVLHEKSGDATLNADIFGCSSTLGGLLSFVQGEDRTFRFGVERIGDTVFLVRKANSPHETIDNVRGYGHTFPEAYTKWDSDVKTSSSHQRIIAYAFGGLHCLVRSECDGFLPKDPENSTAESGAEEEEKKSVTSESLGAILSSLLVANRPPTRPGPLIVRSAGEAVEQESIFDLKTRSIRAQNHNSVCDFLHRLWVNQTPYLILAFHEGGKFEQSNIKTCNVTQDVKEWEIQNQTTLGRYHRILTNMIAMTRSKDHHRLEFRRVGTGPLEIWSEVDDWSALPKALQARWQGRSEDETVAADSIALDPAKDNTADGEGEGDDDNDSEGEGEGEDADYLKF